MAAATLGAVDSSALAGFGDDSSESPPPDVVLASGRHVTIHDGRGGIVRLTSIPRASAFGTYGGGTGVGCTFTAPYDDFPLSDGQRVPEGTEVTSNYVFREGVLVGMPAPGVELPPPGAGVPSRGPLEDLRRTFTVYCDAPIDLLARGVIQVQATDPLFDPRTQIDTMRNALQLERPVVYRNPVVDRFGGLVTRYPSWLAVQPSAWRTQRSNATVYRGLTLYLFAEPRELDFVVDFAPNPEKPSPAYRGVIGCVPAVPAGHETATDALPPLPELPDQAEPGPNGPCMWTPPGPGTVTITARITYTVTFWANGYTEPEADHVWESEPTTYVTGELIAVNTDPNA